MKASTEEAPITARIDGRPTLRSAKVRQVRARDLAVRFVAGALTSVAAGAVTIAFGARAGGIVLAFPAILAASLTLIEQQENSAEAREDARGAVLGGFCARGVRRRCSAVHSDHSPGALARRCSRAWPG